MSEGPTHALRYLGGGTKKISAIKLVRELTHVGLAEAKSIVEMQQVFARGLDLATATAIVERFARETESRVAILEEAEYRYAFDPHHPLRGDQPLVRLRWHGSKLGWERGQIGEWSREREATFESTQARERAVADELVDWAGKGLESTELELDIVRRTSAREPRLEQAIREADPPDEAMAVHADWLQRQGDPRGLVAALDLARARAEQRGALDEAARLDRAFVDALAEHRAHLFGPLAEYERVATLTWHGGLVTRIEIGRTFAMQSDTTREPWRFGDLELATSLLELPICACLRSLRVRSAGAGSQEFAGRLMQADPALLAGLRELALESLFEGFLDCSRMPRLERLELVGGVITPIDLPNLRELVLTMWRPDATAAALRESTLPNLRELQLHYDALAFHGGWPEVPISSVFAELLALPLVASLDTLVLRNDGENWPRWVAQAILDAAERHPGVTFDVARSEYEEDGLALLLAARERRPNLRFE
jgi:hypothetical protein